jgi:hypothetical protein
MSSCCPHAQAESTHYSPRPQGSHQIASLTMYLQINYYCCVVKLLQILYVIKLRWNEERVGSHSHIVRGGVTWSSGPNHRRGPELQVRGVGEFQALDKALTVYILPTITTKWILESLIFILGFCHHISCNILLLKPKRFDFKMIRMSLFIYLWKQQSMLSFLAWLISRNRPESHL